MVAVREGTFIMHQLSFHIMWFYATVRSIFRLHPLDVVCRFSSLALASVVATLFAMKFDAPF